MNGVVLACGGLILAGGPFIPVVDVEELRIGGQGFVPPLLEVDAVSLGMLDRLSQPGHEASARAGRTHSVAARRALASSTCRSDSTDAAPA